MYLSSYNYTYIYKGPAARVIFEILLAFLECSNHSTSFRGKCNSQSTVWPPQKHIAHAFRYMHIYISDVSIYTYDTCMYVYMIMLTGAKPYV